MAKNMDVEIDMPYDEKKLQSLNDSLTNVEDDPWALVDPPSHGKPWKEKSWIQRIITLVKVFGRIAFLLGLLYIFVCALDFLSSAFRLLGGKAAGKAFTNSEILSNPIADLMMGVLATVLVQSSSTSTSIVVSMAAEDIIGIKPAIFIIMGANIGTSVTNTLVAMGQASKRNEFRRAFGGATVHDMFNWLSVICLLPLEWITGSFGDWNDCGLLCQVTGKITKSLEIDSNEEVDKDMLKVITKPLTSRIIQIDKKKLNKIAQGVLDAGDVSLMKMKCAATSLVPEAVVQNGSCVLQHRPPIDGDKEDCDYLFRGAADSWSDTEIGLCLLLISLVLLIICLVMIVKVLHSLLRGQMAKIIKRTVNADFPGPARHLTGYFAILVGAGMTMLLQSSSIFTSAITPLVGVGVLSLDRVYPLTLGSNIGTTFTAILAALAADRRKLAKALQVALCHLFFNILGISIWYPAARLRRIPISLARKLGNTTADYRWFAIVYLALMFFLFPAAVFGLSLAGWQVILCVGLVVIALIAFIVIVNILQKKKPDALVSGLRTWDWVPKPLKSLQPYDKLFSCCKHTLTEEEENSSTDSSELQTVAVTSNNHDSNIGGHTNPSYTAF